MRDHCETCHSDLRVDGSCPMCDAERETAGGPVPPEVMAEIADSFRKAGTSPIVVAKGETLTDALARRGSFTESCIALRDTVYTLLGTDEPAVVAEWIAQARAMARDVGVPPADSHPDEMKPRGATWHQERQNWIAEVAALRAALKHMRARAAQSCYLISLDGDDGLAELQAAVLASHGEHGVDEKVLADAGDDAGAEQWFRNIARAIVRPNGSCGVPNSDGWHCALASGHEGAHWYLDDRSDLEAMVENVARNYVRYGEREMCGGEMRAMSLNDRMALVRAGTLLRRPA